MDAARSDAREVSPSGETAGAGPTTASRSRAWWVRVVLILLLPVLVAAGLYVWQDRERDADAAAAAEDRAALNAATLQTLNWASVDYRDVDTFVEKVKAGATGDFAQQFDESEDALRELIESNESVQVPTHPRTGEPACSSAATTRRGCSSSWTPRSRTPARRRRNPGSTASRSPCPRSTADG